MEAPEFFYRPAAGGTPQLTPEKRISTDTKPDHFIVEDLFDFSNEEDDNAVNADVNNFTTTGTSTESSTVTVVDTCNSSSNCDTQFLGDIACRNFPGANFSNDLCVPYDDLAELEWLSNFVEESFSSEDLQKLQLISGMKARTDQASEIREFQPEPNKDSAIFRPEMPVPGKARSKRSRAAPCNWTSRLLVLSPTTSSSESDVASSFAKKTVKVLKKRDAAEHGSGSVEGRKCLHCATDKTPQWRTGPMGPKTLCNACGVRYKSGRLVPEYRPAASPTFMQTKHSNSHRKVLELRRQKEMQRPQQYLHHRQNMSMVFDGEDYLIHQRVAPDYRQLI